MANITNKSNVKVINNTTGMVSFIGIDDKRWGIEISGGYKTIPMTVIEGLYNDHPSFITNGYIIFDDINVYKYLQIDEEVYTKILPTSKIQEFLDKKSAEEIENELKEMPASIQENVATVAKKNGLDSRKKSKAIKEATGFDVTPDEDLE